MNPFRFERGLVEAAYKGASLRQPLRLGDKVMKNTLPRLSNTSRPSSSASHSPVSKRDRPSMVGELGRKESKPSFSPDVFRSPQPSAQDFFLSPKVLPARPYHRKVKSDQASNVVVLQDHPGKVNKVSVRGRSGSIQMTSPKSTSRYESPQENKPALTRRIRSNNSTPRNKRVIIRAPAKAKEPQEQSTSSTDKLNSLNTSESVDEEERLSLVQYIKDCFRKDGKCPESTLEFYRVGKLIGKGAFGKVISATHKLSGETVAMKTIERSYLAEERHMRKVLQEIAILQKIAHKRVIKILEVFESTHHLLIVMEYAGGGDLLQHVKYSGKLTEEEARPLFRQIVEGAVAIHSANVLHRDFKLDNILLERGKLKVKICDFGVSRVVKKGQRINEQCGTPAYIAPEIIADRGYEGFAADTWSLGVCLYAMLNGMVPFKAQTLKELHKLILTARYVLPDTMSPQAKDLVTRMLQLVPSYRIPLEEALEHPWLSQESTRDISMSYEDSGEFGKRYADQEIVSKVESYGFPRNFILSSLKSGEMNHASASYYLLHSALY